MLPITCALPSSGKGVWHITAIQMNPELQSRRAVAGLETRPPSAVLPLGTGNTAGLETCATGRRANTRGGLIALALLLTGFGCGARPEASRDAPLTNASGPTRATERTQRVRAPAVAGLFYPGDAAVLSKTIDGLLARAPDH